MFDLDFKKLMQEAHIYYNENIERILDQNGKLILGKAHNDAVDAFRHAYVSAIFTYEYGNKTAYLLGLGNEVNGWLDNQPSSERRMDLWNNRAGREIGIDFIDSGLEGEELKNAIGASTASALSSGTLIENPNIITKDQFLLIFSGQEEVWLRMLRSGWIDGDHVNRHYDDAEVALINAECDRSKINLDLSGIEGITAQDIETFLSNNTIEPRIYETDFLRFAWSDITQWVNDGSALLNSLKEAGKTAMDWMGETASELGVTLKDLISTAGEFFEGFFIAEADAAVLPQSDIEQYYMHKYSNGNIESLYENQYGYNPISSYIEEMVNLITENVPGEITNISYGNLNNGVFENILNASLNNGQLSQETISEIINNINIEITDENGNINNYSLVPGTFNSIISTVNIGDIKYQEIQDYYNNFEEFKNSVHVNMDEAESYYNGFNDFKDNIQVDMDEAESYYGSFDDFKDSVDVDMDEAESYYGGFDDFKENVDVDMDEAESYYGGFDDFKDSYDFDEGEISDYYNDFEEYKESIRDEIFDYYYDDIVQELYNQYYDEIKQWYIDNYLDDWGDLDPDEIDIDIDEDMVMEYASSEAESLLDQYVDEYEVDIGEVESYYSGFQDYIDDNISNYESEIRSYYNDFRDYIDNNIDNYEDAIRSYYDNFRNYINDNIDNYEGEIRSYYDNFRDYIDDNIDNYEGEIRSYYNDFIEYVENNIDNYDSEIRDYYNDFLDYYVDEAYNNYSDNYQNIETGLDISNNEDAPILIDIGLPLESDLSIQDVYAQNGKAVVIGNKLLYIPDDDFNGSDTLTYTVTGNGSELTENLVINLNPVNDAPELANEIENQEIESCSNFTLDISEFFTDCDSDLLSYEAVLEDGSVLPDWISFDNNTGIFSGIPNNEDSANLDIKVTASDGKEEVSNIFNLIVNANIEGTSENDILTGGQGNDTISGNSSADLLIGNSGDDILNFSKDIIWGSGWVAWNVGSPDNIINGEKVTVKPRYGNFDVFDGGEGYDIIELTSGSDAVFLDNQYSPAMQEGARIIDIEEIKAGAGNDIVDLTSRIYVVSDIKVKGEAGDDVIWTSSGNDVISGGEGNDSINGGTGNDIISGNRGQDILYGSLGDDIFDYSSLEDSEGSVGDELEMDTIMDFIHSQDRINLSNLGFTGIEIGAGTGSTLGYEIIDGNTFIHDADSDFSIKLVGEHNLVQSDFVFE